MRAIRIIRSEQTQPAPDVSAVDREEQRRAVERLIREALGPTSAERIQTCVDKLRQQDHDDHFVDKALGLADQGIHLAPNPVAVHGDIDITRILQLLED